MAKSWCHLRVSKEVFDRVMEQCRTEFLEQNPDFEESFLTQNFMVDRISKHYLGEL